MFSGNSSRKNNLINLILDDPHMIYTTTDKKANEELSIKHQHRKRHGRWTGDKRCRSSDRSKDVWEDNYADFKACDGMPAKRGKGIQLETDSVE